MMYTIKSHWNAIASRLNGRTYDTEGDALAAIRHCVGDDMVVESLDDGTYVWTYQERRDADPDGSRACAIVEVQS